MPLRLGWKAGLRFQGSQPNHRSPRVFGGVHFTFGASEQGSQCLAPIALLLPKGNLAVGDSDVV